MSQDRRLLVANWKMNLELSGARVLASEVAHTLAQELQAPLPVVLAPAFPLLSAVAHLIKDLPRMVLAAQDVSAHGSGAYTGEVSAAMLASAGCRYVLVGHSERRLYHGEQAPLLAAKLEQLWQAGLTPIYCLGETLEQREGGRHLQAVRDMLEGCLPQLRQGERRAVLAYEPVWAIGTGRNATPSQAQEMHAALRAMLAEAWGEAEATQTTLLYGGSVSAAQAAGLFAAPDVDGALVGGASLRTREFVDIARALAQARPW